ncbi:phosphatase PAP2 family protein [Cronobacter sakazakii]|nr:phosphatase PAP2 family protein [Cronobacter sakazakii]
MRTLSPLFWPARPRINKTISLYSLPVRFYVGQLALLTALGVLFTWLSHTETLDRWLTQMWFDAAAGNFPWQDNPWLDLLNHRLAKYCAIAVAVGSLLYGVIRRHPRWMMVAVLMGLGAAVVGILKATSHHSCPWDLVEYGGKALSYPLFGAVPDGSGPGRCFPGGHASSGFMVMGLWFGLKREHPGYARLALAAGIALGLAMGFGQVMRGAHFFTHNLWAGWWVWLTQVATWGVTTTLMNKEPATL